MTLDDTPMFDPTLLKDLDWNQNTVKFTPDVSPSSPGEGLVLRPLCTVDFNRGLFDLLSQLTKVGEVTTEQFLKKFEHMKQTGDYYIVVIEDTKLEQIIGSATLLIEHKFIHSCAKRGRIEEVIVRDECRGKQLGKLLIAVLTLLSKKLNCYKTTLECLPKNTAFYEKFGFKVGEDVYMQNRFFD
ncbi:glucosamine 6-phosphate N-acetyltransferase [Callorhinchus milii]|nr:glucosamine 6-phosphate N-acetyltransferase [Callorhinchus milii]|eukprot:gi/632942323/ref/XP_007886349.1/ PREDICTED: glucosamine 6-phosphate N-acetyltransferase [Callorhinchus milii]